MMFSVGTILSLVMGNFKIVMWAVLGLAVLIFIAMVYRAGKKSVLVDVMEKGLKNAKYKQKILRKQAEVATRRPDSPDAFDELFEKGKF